MSAVVKAKMFAGGPTGDFGCHVESLGWRGWWCFIFLFPKVARKGQSSKALQCLHCTARDPSCLQEHWRSHSKATGVQVTPCGLGHMPHTQGVFSSSISSVKKQAGFMHCAVQIAGLHPPRKCGSGNSVYLSQKHLPGKLVFSFTCWYCGPLGLVCCPVSQAAQLAGIFLAPLHL